MAEVLDLRGRRPVRDRASVLLDPSGGRARVLAWVGRAVAFVFLLWLVGLVFAGLGLLPSSVLPLGRALVGPASAPPALKAMPRLTQPRLLNASAGGGSAVAATRAGIIAGTRGAHASAGASTSGRSTGGKPGTRAAGGVPSTRAHGHGAPTVNRGGGEAAANSGSVAATTTPASSSNNGLHTGSSSAPGRTQSQSSPGHTNTSTGAGSHGSSSGNGHPTTTTTTTSTTTPGKSGSAPGHSSGH